MANYSLDMAHIEMLNTLQEKAKTSKSYLIREFIRYFSEKEKEFEQLIKDGEIKRAKVK